MKRKKIHSHHLLCLIAILLISSCEKFVAIDPPQTQIEQSNAFRDDATAISAAVGLYYRLTQGNNTFFNGALTFYPGILSDELTLPASNETYDPFLLNNLDRNVIALNSTFWNTPYNFVFHANSVIEGVDRSSTLSSGVSRQLKGEMLVIRSLIYFYMVNLFGDVPLVRSTDVKTNELMARTQKTVIVKQLIDDLSEAKQLLKNEYPSSERLRVNKMAAAALLARIYLYEGNWAGAESAASEVINSGLYILGTLDNAFLYNSPEAILQLSTAITSSTVTAEGSVFIPTTATRVPLFTITTNLKSAFEPGDLRLAKWTKTNTVGGVGYTYPFKYKTRTSTAGAAKPEYVMMLRLGEMYLIRAEALAKQGKLSDAITDLDMIRSRAGLIKIKDSTPSISQAALLNTIYHENQIEFFAELGHRWFDLKRTGSVDNIMATNKPNWQATDALLPIPFEQILNNPFLTQNPGYN